MTLARVKVWIAGDVLTAADLNAEFNNILNNPGTLISPLSANLNVGNFQLTNLRLENITTTQTAGQIGRVMFNSTSDSIDVDDGTSIFHVPAFKSSQVSSTGAAGVNQSIARAWVAFNGVAASSQLTALAAFNVSTSANAIIRNSAGSYTVNWLNPFASTGYAINVSVVGSTQLTVVPVIAGYTTASANVVVFRTSDQGTVDANYVAITAFGVQV